MTYVGNLNINESNYQQPFSVAKSQAKSFVKPSDLDYGTDTVTFGHHQPQQRRKFSFFRAASNLVKGGMYDTIRGMFSLKGLMMMGVTTALITFTGGAAIPFLAAGGLMLGGFQVLKGSSRAIALYKAGDTYGAENSFRDIGSGLATGTMSFIGLRSAYRSGLVNTQRTIGEVTIKANEAASSIKGTFQQLIADLTGKSTVTGKESSLFSEAISNFQTKFANFRTGKFQTLKTNLKTTQGRSDLYQQGNEKFTKIKSDYVDTTVKDVKSFISPENGITRGQIVKNNSIYKILKPKYDNGTLSLVGVKANQAGRSISKANEEYENFLREYYKASYSNS